MLVNKSKILSKILYLKIKNILNIFLIIILIIHLFINHPGLSINEYNAWWWLFG